MGGCTLRPSLKGPGWNGGAPAGRAEGERDARAPATAVDHPGSAVALFAGCRLPAAGCLPFNARKPRWECWECSFGSEAWLLSNARKPRWGCSFESETSAPHQVPFPPPPFRGCCSPRVPGAQFRQWLPVGRSQHPRPPPSPSWTLGGVGRPSGPLSRGPPRPKPPFGRPRSPSRWDSPGVSEQQRSAARQVRAGTQKRIFRSHPEEFCDRDQVDQVRRWRGPRRKEGGLWKNSTTCGADTISTISSPGWLQFLPYVCWGVGPPMCNILLRARRKQSDGKRRFARANSISVGKPFPHRGGGAVARTTLCTTDKRAQLKHMMSPEHRSRTWTHGGPTKQGLPLPHTTQVRRLKCSSTTCFRRLRRACLWSRAQKQAHRRRRENATWTRAPNGPNDTPISPKLRREQVVNVLGTSALQRTDRASTPAPHKSDPQRSWRAPAESCHRRALSAVPRRHAWPDAQVLHGWAFAMVPAFGISSYRLELMLTPMVVRNVELHKTRRGLRALNGRQPAAGSRQPANSATAEPGWSTAVAGARASLSPSARPAGAPPFHPGPLRLGRSVQPPIPGINASAGHGPASVRKGRGQIFPKTCSTMPGLP
eukprot:gene17906-biopygen2368